MRQLAILLCLLLPFSAAADSPLTSTPFHQAYMDVKIVTYAKETGKIDKKIAKYLMKKKKPLDVKLAAINAIGWKLAGQQNAQVFADYLGAKRGSLTTLAGRENLTPDEAICMAYLIAMDDYFNPGNAMTYVELALSKGGQRYSLNMIAALVQAQIAFDYDWCEVFQIANRVDTNPQIERDMREPACAIIMEYMSLYQGDC